MRLKVVIFLVSMVGFINMASAQIEMECKSNLSLFHQYVKSKNYERAYIPCVFVLTNCPELNIAAYSDGEKILKHKIKESFESEQKSFLNELLMVWEKRAKYFPDKTPKGEFMAKTYQLMYDYRDVLEKSTEELYNGFDNAFQEDKKNFTNPKSLYTYFSLMVDLHDAGKKSLKEVFDKYDDVDEKIEEEVKNYSMKLNKLITKEEQGADLTKREKQLKASYESYLKNYNIISESIIKKVDTRADCPNLIPVYTRDFEVHKNDAVWLKRAVSRMYHKECTEEPLYEKLVKAYDEVAPSAETKIYVVTVLIKNGKADEVDQYLAEAYNLEIDAFKKSKLAYRIGLILKKKRSYSQARSYFRKALKLNPSNGRPHLAIAAMYAASANNCGDDSFNKRAVYWLAAKEARKASRVDPTIKKNADKFVKRYEALAPSKEMIFLCACSGKEIKIPCWIQASVIVPKIN